MQTHLVPVGFDYDRLIAPLVRDQLRVDRAILLEGAMGSEENVEYSRTMARKLEANFRNLLGAETERFLIEDVYDYDGAFEGAYDLINAELDAGNEVWVNVSAMPRTVSFAFATAAHSIMIEREEQRNAVHTYYTAPEKYLETDLAEELRRSTTLLADLEAELDEEYTARVVDRVESARELLGEFDERGTTVGAKSIEGDHVVELPVASFSPVKPFEELILFKLGEDGPFESVSELAHALADGLEEEYTDSFRSKVIYNVDRLGPGGKGYVERDERGKSYRTELSRIGELWVRAHAESEGEKADHAGSETDERSASTGSRPEREDGTLTAVERDGTDDRSPKW